MFRDDCFQPADSLFNWKASKDPKGTVKKELPRIVVTPPPPPATSTRPVVQRKKSKRPSKTRRCVPAPPPPKLVLDPDFWSHQPETQKGARKQRIQFTCRKPQCSEQFPSARDRQIHEGFCLSFIQVIILFMFLQSRNNLSYRCPLVSSFILKLYLLRDF